MIRIKAKKISPNMGLINLNELDKLIEKVKKTEDVELTMVETDIPIEGIMKLEDESGAYDFLKDPNEDLYSVSDLKVKYK